MDRENAHSNHIGAIHRTAFKNDQAALHEAENAAAASKSITMRETWHSYKKAILWSMVLSTALIMEGFDVVIINSFFGQDAFLNRFGTLDPTTGKRYIPTNWQAAVNNAASIGEVIGLIANGYCQSRFGAKRTYLVSMAFMAAAIFLPVFSTSLEMLFAAELVQGIPWGVFQTLTTAYAADIVPIQLRGYLTSYVNCCWGIGLTIGAAVVRASLSISADSDWGWRMPYVCQWVWPIPLFFIVLFAPESPWWLVKNGRKDDAAKSLRKLARADHWTEEKIEAELAYMEHTIEMERAANASGSWKELFKGTNARRTEIVCVVWSCQYWCGQPISNFATEFLEAAGMSEDDAFDLNVANFCMIMVGTFISWAFFYRFGRRFLYIFGLVSMAACFLIIGILGCLNSQVPSVALGIGVTMIVLTFAFGISIAPACYTIVAEIPATNVRAQSVVLARTCYILSQACLQQLFPRFLTPQPSGWNLGGKCGFIFVAINLGLALYCYFRLPETMGRTFGEIDVLFEARVPARKFATSQVDEFEADRVANEVLVDDSGDKKL